MNAEIILNSLTLFAILITFYFQNEKIKSLNTSLITQKAILDAVKTYFDIFKIDELKKYVVLTEHNYKKESEMKFQETINSMTQDFNTQRDQMYLSLDASTKSMAHLYGFALSLLFRLPPSTRKQLVDENLKDKNLAIMLNIGLQQMENLYVPLQVTISEQLGSNSSSNAA